MGSRELEKVWVALAGSYTEKWLVNAEKDNARSCILEVLLSSASSFPSLYGQGGNQRIVCL